MPIYGIGSTITSLYTGWDWGNKRTKFSLKFSKKYFGQVHGHEFGQKCQHFYKSSLCTPLVQFFRAQTKIFLKPFTSLHITKIVIRLAPPRFFLPMKCILGFPYEYWWMRPK